MKRFFVSIFTIPVTAGLLFAGDGKRAVVPVSDDLTRDAVMQAPSGGQTTMRDPSGRTVGTASTAGTRTTFRDGSGRTTGSATVEGKRSVFRDASGRTVRTATASGNQTTTYRDAAGRTVGAASESKGRTIFHNASGRTTSTVQQSGSGATVRDAVTGHWAQVPPRAQSGDLSRLRHWPRASRSSQESGWDRLAKELEQIADLNGDRLYWARSMARRFTFGETIFETASHNPLRMARWARSLTALPSTADRAIWTPCFKSGSVNTSPICASSAG